MDIRIQKALETWHGGFDERGRINCYLSMLGELGEITNLYRKLFFKPGHEGISRETLLNEWGDFWYYVRLFAYFKKLPLPIPDELARDGSFEGTTIHYLTSLSREVTQILESELNILEGELDEEATLKELVNKLAYFLFTLNCSFDELTELNYHKLIANQSHHGWKNELSPIMKEDFKEKWLGFDKAKGESKTVIGVWKKEEDGSFTPLRSISTPFTEEEFKMLKEGNWSEYDLQKEQIAKILKDKSDLIQEPIEEELGEDEKPPLVEADYDWREEMQKRIRERERISRELRGRWY